MAAVALSPPVQATLRRLQPQLDALLAASPATPASLREDLAVVPGLAEAAPGDDAVVLAAVQHLTTRRTTADRVVLHELAAHLGPWLRHDPHACLSSMASAAREVDRRPGALAQWTARLVAAAPQASDPEQLRALGVLAAWRSGLVRLRWAAHSLAATVPEPALDAVLQVSDGRAVLAANAVDPWAWPSWEPAPGELRVLVRSGGFLGLGGPWAVPPVALSGDGARWRVRCGPTEHLLLWDVHGDAVRPADGAGGPDSRRDPLDRSDVLDRRGMLHLAGLTAPVPWPDDTLTGAAVAGRSAVLSRAGSHHLDLLRAGRAA